MRFRRTRRDAYYPGNGLAEAGSPLYTRGEGYYWNRLYLTSPGEATLATSLGLPYLYRQSPEAVTVRARLNGASGSAHDVRLEADLDAARVLDRRTWLRYAFQDLTGTFSVTDVAANGSASRFGSPRPPPPAAST